MSIEIGMITIHCDSCLARLVHDPSLDPVSSFTSYPRWSSKDAVAFATNNGWVIQYDHDLQDLAVQCPSCASGKAAVKFNRSEGKNMVIVGTDKRVEQSRDDEW